MKTASLTDVKGIGPSTASMLSEHGITSVEQLAAAGSEALESIPGFSTARALMVTTAASETLGDNSSPAPEPAIAEQKGAQKGKKRKKKIKGKGKKTAKKKDKNNKSKKKKKKKGRKGKKKGSGKKK